MDSVRDEVLAICEKVADAANSEALWHEKGPGGAYKRDPEHEMTPSEGADAIMSALERVPGVVVSPLTWEHVEGASDDGDAWFAKALNGLRYGVWDRGADGFEWELETEDGDLLIADGTEGTKQAAQDACRDDLANRITSAVEPAPVVITAEMARRLEPLLPPFSASPKELSEAITAVLSPRSEEERWAEVEAVIQARDGRKKREDEALTAALSSRTEEEVRADERERLARLLDGDTKGTVNRSAITKWLRSPARSLTNGGE